MDAASTALFPGLISAIFCGKSKSVLSKATADPRIAIEVRSDQTKTNEILDMRYLLPDTRDSMSVEGLGSFALKLWNSRSCPYV